MLQVNSRWFQGVDPAGKEQLLIKLGNSRVILDHLRDILIKDLDNLERPKIEDYEVAHWPALQADKNGQARTLRNLIRMLTIQETTSE